MNLSGNPTMQTDKQIMKDIAEYRAIRSIMDDLIIDGIPPAIQISNVLGKALFDRMMLLNKSTWPDRNEKFRAFNDACEVML